MSEATKAAPWASAYLQAIAMNGPKLQFLCDGDAKLEADLYQVLADLAASAYRDGVIDGRAFEKAASVVPTNPLDEKEQDDEENRDGLEKSGSEGASGETTPSGDSINPSVAPGTGGEGPDLSTRPTSGIRLDHDPGPSRSPHPGGVVPKGGEGNSAG